LYREASLALAVSHRRAQDFMRAIALLLPIVSHDPANEAAQRELMRTYALAGRRHEALRQYQICVDALAKEFDAPPKPAISGLPRTMACWTVGSDSEAWWLAWLSQTSVTQMAFESAESLATT
jgi:DNA-binding SARP family transcriptional activator